jgi:2-alkyl-3-oxoalkanoate reductase
VNALVTGASGFLGQYIVEQLLARGDRVRALCRRRFPRLEALGVEVVSGNLCDRQTVSAACRDMDVVFHVGGVAGMGGPWRRFYENNVIATQHIIDGCLERRVGRLVFTSSPSVTFRCQDQRNVDESAPYAKHWLCHYAHSKAIAEQHVLAANRNEGLLTCALRPHLIWGPRDRHLIPQLLHRAKTGQLHRIGDGRNMVDMVYVENAARAHLLAADALHSDSPVAGSAYFITQGEPVNCWDWLGKVIELAGLPPIRKFLSFRVAWLLGMACEFGGSFFQLYGEPPMTRFVAAQLSMSHYFNIARARKDLGYEPTISTAEGIRRMVSSWKNDAPVSREDIPW